MCVARRAGEAAVSETRSETPDSALKAFSGAVTGVSAAYVGCRVCPSASSMRNPAPSLPVLGTESPPVATITASASSVSAASVSTSSTPMRQRPACGARLLTRQPKRAATPCRRASASKPSRTSRALCEAGKSLADSTSSSSTRPTSLSKNRICSASGQLRTILRSVLGEESVTKRDSSTRDGSTLQRPPPLMRILRPPSRVRSSSTVSAPPRAAKIAAIVPAAPAPITTTRCICLVLPREGRTAAPCRHEGSMPCG